MPQVQTIVVVAVFACVYLFYIFRKTIYGQLDLYDLIMLSMVALVPALFTFLPGLALRVSDALGVAFPFVVMFGMLFVVIFVLLHRMTTTIHKLEHRTRSLVQENGLLRYQLDTAEAERSRR